MENAGFVPPIFLIPPVPAIPSPVQATDSVVARVVLCLDSKVERSGQKAA